MSGRINVQEAAQLARLTSQRLNCSARAAMREIAPEDLDDETMEDFLKAVDYISNVF